MMNENGLQFKYELPYAGTRTYQSQDIRAVQVYVEFFPFGNHQMVLFIRDDDIGRILRLESHAEHQFGFQVDYGLHAGLCDKYGLVCILFKLSKFMLVRDTGEHYDERPLVPVSERTARLFLGEVSDFSKAVCSYVDRSRERDQIWTPVL